MRGRADECRDLTLSVHPPTGSTDDNSGVSMFDTSELQGGAERHSIRPTVSCSLSELSRMAGARQAVSRAELRLGDPVSDPEIFYRQGSQDIHALSEDLALVRSDFCGFHPMRINLDVRGLLYFHFRLEGTSEEEIPGLGRRRLDRDCFIVSATSRPELWVRDLVGDAWRTVGIICRPPAFAAQELQWLGDNLPEALRCFRSGEDVEFAFVGDLTAEMRSAVQSLMHTRMPREIRDTYLRAKVVELVCLALARIRERQEAETTTNLPVRLHPRDVEAIQHARRILLASSPIPPLAVLARRVGINRNKLAFGFKHLYGVTIGEFDRATRLERARRLLQREELPIRCVASLAGYEDPGSFSKAFRLEYGVLPSELRGMGEEKVTEARFIGTAARHAGPA
jgi:AraC-like DNA-binding protein